MAVLERKTWVAPPVFTWLQEQGQINDIEMARTFNCGIGMVVIVAKEYAAAATKLLQTHGETVFTVGSIRARAQGEKQTIVV